MEDRKAGFLLRLRNPGVGELPGSLVTVVGFSGPHLLSQTNRKCAPSPLPLSYAPVYALALLSTVTYSCEILPRVCLDS